VNLILFQPHEIAQPLPTSDPRAVHLCTVLHRTVGGEFDAGIVNGPRGKGRLLALDATTITWEFTPTHPASAADSLTLIVGLCRPQTARDILREATTLGVAALHFVAAERSEPSYAHATLWRDRDWERHVIAGATQAFSTQLPGVTVGETLAAALATLSAPAARIALDNYEATAPLAAHSFSGHEPLVLAFGPERGWGARDRTTLRAAGFSFAHLGSRVLRLETALVVALALAKAARGTL
jgi:RsmE family RNA methyltransferase